VLPLATSFSHLPEPFYVCPCNLAWYGDFDFISAASRKAARNRLHPVGGNTNTPLYSPKPPTSFVVIRLSCARFACVTTINLNHWWCPSSSKTGMSTDFVLLFICLCEWQPGRQTPPFFPISSSLLVNHCFRHLPARQLPLLSWWWIWDMVSGMLESWNPGFQFLGILVLIDNNKIFLSVDTYRK